MAKQIENQKTPVERLNDGGYLFQLRIEWEIRNTSNRHGYRIVAREHRYVEPVSGDEGFIDLVLEHNSGHRIVVECKRRSDEASWVFAVPRVAYDYTGRARIAWSHQRPPAPNLEGWADYAVDPVSFESMFCMTRVKTTDNRTATLEHIAGGLLLSLEALIEEEWSLTPSVAEIERRYIPMIVTNAKLDVCRFDLDDIGLATGMLPPDKVESATVPIVRFRKGLASWSQRHLALGNLPAANHDQERTVLVVNAEALTDVLAELQSVSLMADPPHPPWARYRNMR